MHQPVDPDETVVPGSWTRMDYPFPHQGASPVEHYSDGSNIAKVNIGRITVQSRPRLQRLFQP